MPPPVVLEIPAKPEYLALVRQVVAQVALHHHDLPDERVADLKIAVSEACTNAVEAHGAAARDDERVVVRCHDLEDSMVVEIEDRGSGFDPTRLPEHPPATDPRRLEFERGLGLHLIRSLVDDVNIESSGDGTSVRMTMVCGRAAGSVGS